MKNENPIIKEDTKSFREWLPENLRNIKYQDLISLCTKHFQSLPYNIVDFSNEDFFFNQRKYGGANVIYRARVITDKTKSPHKTLSEISFIPKDKTHKITKYGRANKPNESMFYGSLNLPTACTEVVTKGNLVENQGSVLLSVGVWKFEHPLKLVQLPYSLKYIEELYKQISFDEPEGLISEINKSNLDIKNSLKNDEAYENLMFFADQFAKWDIKNDYEYKLSNYFSDRVFNRLENCPIDEEIDGIIYPSTIFSFQEKNIVLKPEVIENKLSFVEAMQVWFINDLGSKEKAQFIPIQQRIRVNDEGKLLWNSHKNSP
jgi:hypothetical protein